MYKSATLENDSIVDLPKKDKTMNQGIKDIDSINISLTPEFKEDTFGDRLRKSRIELGLSISEVAKLCDVTYSVVSGYECNRYYPTKEVLNLLSSKFDIDYLCIEGYTKFVYNFDEFLDRLKLWMTENNYTREVAANKIGVSRTLFRYWFNGGIIKINTYYKIINNLIKYKLI